MIERAAYGKANGVGHLRADGDDQRAEAMLVGIPGAVGEAAEPRHGDARIYAAADGHGEVAVVGEDPVSLGHRLRGAHLDGLMAGDLPPEAQLALPLEVQPPLLRAAAY